MSKDNIFCCERLKGLYNIGNEYKPNFRVILNSDEFINQHLRRGIKIDREFRFIITQGYSKHLSSKETDSMFINNCPFCGAKLNEMYNNKSYINEVNHSW
ncbi:hypothetical protein [Flavivirga jejuensis]|uniref:Uncharacterized protein n=1 Tax=Flavivirga jejuensis TaxID=870487 RepID=A0ABT8WPE9_9FLAO|nr:hypothetical protein [Flavivirga jejuensis]MDO5975021.1 hypothetical protein [Flavivirga jejuensis]